MFSFVSTATFFLQGKEKHKYKKVIFDWTFKVIYELILHT